MTRPTELPSEYAPDWLESLDGRTRLSRVVNERYRELAGDLGGDLSYQQKSLCKRAIWLEALIEQQEAALARGEEVNSGALTQQTNSLLGLLRALGLHRVARDVPSLTDYLAKRGQA